MILTRFRDGDVSKFGSCCNIRSMFCKCLCLCLLFPPLNRCLILTDCLFFVPVSFHCFFTYSLLPTFNFQVVVGMHSCFQYSLPPFPLSKSKSNVWQLMRMEPHARRHVGWLTGKTGNHVHQRNTKKHTNTHEKWLRNEKHSSAVTKKKDFVRMDWRIVLGMSRTKCTRELFGVIMFLLHFQF